MGKKRRALLAIVLLAALAAGAWFFFGARGPVYHGKSLTRWVDDCSAEARSNRLSPGYYIPFMSQYPRAVRRMGPSVVPPLIRMLEAKHLVEGKVYDLLRSKKLQYKWTTNYVNKLSLDLLRPRTAAYFLGCLGPDAEPAIPALMRAAVDTNEILSRNAIDALGAIHQRPEVVIPFLIGLATGTNPAANLPAMSAMAQYTNQPQMVLPTLIRAIEDTPRNQPGDTTVSIVASRLGRFGTNAVAAVPALRQFATNSARGLLSRYMAASALQQIAPDSSDDVVILVGVAMLEKSSFNMGYTAILGLYELGPRARAATPALLDFISTKDPESWDACYALKSLDPDAAAKIWPDELRRSSESARSMNQLLFQPETLEQFAGRFPARDDKTVSNLIAILKKDDKSFNPATEKKYAAHLLGDMGPAARAAIPALEEADDSPAAIAALMKIRGQSVAPLIKQLENTFESPFDQMEWRDLAQTVGEFGANAEAAVPVLVKTLNRPPEYFLDISAAAQALGEIRRQPEICVPALIPLLDFPSASIRKEAVVALAKFQKDAAPALPKIVQSLDDLDAGVRLEATNALKQIDPEAAARAGVK